MVDDLAELQHSSSATGNLSGGNIDRVATENGTRADIGYAVEHPSVEVQTAHYPSPLVRLNCFLLMGSHQPMCLLRTGMS